jgi:NADH dehydrogenase
VVGLAEPEASLAGAAASTGPTARHRIVIVGAGFGGLTTAKALARADADIVLIDRRNHHLFQPLLYQVATAGLAPTQIASPIRTILRHQANTRVVLGEVEGVDVAGKAVLGQGRRVPYDTLVIATGATHAYFGHDEWAAAAPGLKTLEDAVSIRRRVLSAFEAAEIAEDPAERRRLLTFVIVGAGPTGVEMAGAIAELGRRALKADFRAIRGEKARVVLVEAGPRALAAFAPELSDYTRRALERLGVEVKLNAAVTAIDDGGVQLGEERLESRTLVWAAGVRASPAAAWLGCEADRAGRVVVEPDLTVPGHPEIFVIGDTAHVRQEDGSPVPGLAPAANQEGAYVASLILHRLRGAPYRAGPFSYNGVGILATIGRAAGVVQLDSIRFNGLLGWLFWSIVHIFFLIGFRNRFTVSLDWMISYLTFERGARLITGTVGPPD